MNTRLIIVILFAVFMANITTGCATSGSFAEAFGKEKTISINKGGNIKTFQYAADEVLENNWKIKIDGPCYSACAVFADKARPNVCITDKAVFGFHLGTKTVDVYFKQSSGDIPLKFRRKVPPPASSDIWEWLDKRGGFPSEGFLIMQRNEATAFWPVCKD